MSHAESDVERRVGRLGPAVLGVPADEATHAAADNGEDGDLPVAVAHGEYDRHVTCPVGVSAVWRNSIGFFGPKS